MHKPAGHEMRPRDGRRCLRTRGSAPWSGTLRFAAGVVVLTLLPGLVADSPAQGIDYSDTLGEWKPLSVDEPSPGPRLPIHTLPSPGPDSFVFPAPRDYQPRGLPYSDPDPWTVMPPSGPLAPAPSPLENIDWDGATAIDLKSTGEQAAPPCYPFRQSFFRGAGAPPLDDWIVGNGNRMGMYTLAVYGEPEFTFGRFHPRLSLGAAIHWISGPVRTDLPPRVYDFTVGLPFQGTIGQEWSYDLTVRAGWYSDFEASATEGIRFPSHAVLYRRASECWQWVLGLEYLDRDDVSLLPVGGALWTPSDDWRIEAVFPKPLVAYRLPEDRWIYLAAEMGGGTWDIQRAEGAEDVFTYRDFRILIGRQSKAGTSSDFFEIGYVFSRHLEYRSGTPDYSPPGTTVLRSVKRY